jgi:hypothetical protein
MHFFQETRYLWCLTRAVVHLLVFWSTLLVRYKNTPYSRHHVVENNVHAGSEVPLKSYTNKCRDIDCNERLDYGSYCCYDTRIIGMPSLLT